MMMVSTKKLAEQKKSNKRGLMLKNYTDCLFNNKILLKSQQRVKVIIIMYTLNKSIRLH